MRKKDNKDKKHCNKKIVIILLIAVLGIGSFLGEKGSVNHRRYPTRNSARK